MNGKQAVAVGSLGSAAAWLTYQFITVWYPLIPAAADWQEAGTTIAAFATLYSGIFRALGWIGEKTNAKS